MTDPQTGRPFLRIFDHDLETWPYVEWRGWFVECRRPDGTVVDTHPVWGLHGTQQMAFRAALQHLRESGCPLDADAARAAFGAGEGGGAP